MQLRHLLYAVLLNSANDAAVVVAEGLAGSEEGFAARMNARARAIGATNSHFENPHGLTAPGHVSTARDLSTIFRYGMRMPLFRQILSTRTIDVPIESTSTHMVSLRSHNRLLTGYSYPVIGKTGYTRPARRCFVGAAEHDGREVVIALLGATDLWGDAKRLLAMGLGAPGGRDVAPSRRPLLMAGMVPSLSLPRSRHRPAHRVAAARGTMTPWTAAGGAPGDTRWSWVRTAARRWRRRHGGACRAAATPPSRRAPCSGSGRSRAASALRRSRPGCGSTATGRRS